MNRVISASSLPIALALFTGLLLPAGQVLPGDPTQSADRSLLRSNPEGIHP